MDGYIKKSEAVDVIVKYPYNISGKTATAIKMIEGLPDADVVPKSECVEYEYKFCHIVGNAKVYTKTLEDYYEARKSIEEDTKRSLEISQNLLKDAWKRIDELDELCGALQHKYDLAVAEREANVKGFTEELSKAYSEIEQLKRNLEQCENGYKQTIHLLKCQHKGEKEQIFVLIWDAFQSTYYDSEFEEKFDKIEKKFTEGTQ